MASGVIELLRKCFSFVNNNKPQILACDSFFRYERNRAGVLSVFGQPKNDFVDVVLVFGRTCCVLLPFYQSFAVLAPAAAASCLALVAALTFAIGSRYPSVFADSCLHAEADAEVNTKCAVKKQNKTRE